MHTVARILAPLLVFVIAACSPAEPTTPPEGSPEREAIFTAMRQGREIRDQIFVATHFKVQGDWAWITADPQSKDGANRYEPESWLLQKTTDGWRVMAQPCQEADCVWTDEVAKIRTRFPQAPEAIFPK